ncbi:META domain-containing protein [Breznakiella homolactica]|uniref:META domain-containing protein n=1 Tax=Breznakiella homolactica TaxID=2798577 RepID=A0A7T8BAZ9_9SPIR|nr:META domain-containing protein [Breznakiella homolactica]QQO10022.1 META domain-containing protein [Breznakiella homolactica]
MRSIGKILISAAAAALVFASCASGPSAGKTTVNFSEIQGKEWKLVEVKDPAVPITLNRSKMESDSMGNMYTIEFLTDGKISGTGAPNRYFGPYELGDGQAIKFGNVASTLMANIVDPFGLREYQYFTYLGSVTRWNVNGKGQLELYTANSAGTETVLVFSDK